MTVTGQQPQNAKDVCSEEWRASAIGWMRNLEMPYKSGEEKI